MLPSERQQQHLLVASEERCLDTENLQLSLPSVVFTMLVPITVPTSNKDTVRNCCEAVCLAFVRQMIDRGKAGTTQQPKEHKEFFEKCFTKHFVSFQIDNLCHKRRPYERLI
jgi:hypothetical protein